MVDILIRKESDGTGAPIRAEADDAYGAKLFQEYDAIFPSSGEHMNAYDMLEELRDNVNEATASHWTDATLLRKLNIAQRKVALRVAMAIGNWLISSKLITPSNGLIALPDDCAKPLYMEEYSTGEPIFFKTAVQDRRVSRQCGTQLSASGSMEAYPLMDYLEVNQDGYANQVRLWYQIRIPDLHTGMANDGGVTQLDLDTTDGADSTGHGARPTDDYYNNVKIEVVSGTGSPAIDTITDYAATNRRCVVTSTYDSTSVYGTIPRGVPEEGHGLIILEATCLALAKPSSVMSPEVFKNFQTIKKEHWSEFRDFISTRLITARHTRITHWE